MSVFFNFYDIIIHKPPYVTFHGKKGHSFDQ